MIKKTIIYFFAILYSIATFGQKETKVSSPDGKIEVEIKLGEKITYDVYYGGSAVFKDCLLALEVENRILGVNPKLQKISKETVNEQIKPIVPLKFSVINNEYNRLLLKFKNNYSVEFKAFNDGIAYRFITDLKKEIRIMDETISLNFPKETIFHLQLADRFKTSYEEYYQHLKKEDWNNGKMATMPLLAETKSGLKILVCESDLTDYPATFFKNTEQGIDATYPKVPLEFGDESHVSVKILKEAEYIAKTDGKRTFPWRYMVISPKDEALIENTMSARLAGTNQITDYSWIKPGQSTWEWWNGTVPYGPEVNFIAGNNTETYKYFIDFAARYGINYVMIDGEWMKDKRDAYTPKDGLNLQEVVKYGKEKGVDLFLWLSWLTVENNFECFEKISGWGFKGLKIDFMDRSDQWMVNYYERVAKEAAKYKLVIDFHGAFKPAGLEYKYPNILSYEGVRGLEQMGGCKPENSIFLPFMRNAVGAMDFTPGAMYNYQPEHYRAERPNSGAIGTRAYQMGLFIIFESGLQMMADNPAMYYMNDDCTKFMANVPVTWDETRALKAKVGEYAIVAKRKGNKWYIGGMTNNQEKERTFELPLDFLNDDQIYQMTSFEDGVNANRQAMHYIKNVSKVKKGQTIQIKLARNGGFAAILE